MSAKIHCFGDDGRGNVNWVFHCPGCECGHPVAVPRWSWNGSVEAPTFRPSLLCNQHDPASRCHSFITDGKIQFLSDCFHALAGQMADLPDWEKLR